MNSSYIATVLLIIGGLNVNLLEVEISIYILSATVWAKMIQYVGIIGI